MNKATLIAKIAEKSALNKKQAEAALNAFTDTIVEALKEGDKVQLMGFGTFEPQARHRRDHRDSCKEVSHLQGRQGSEGSVLIHFPNVMRGGCFQGSPLLQSQEMFFI